MKRKWPYLAALFIEICIAGASSTLSTLPTAPHVDLARYQGTWYEVARLPLYWERECAADITAAYTLRPDGKIDVVNRCRKANGRDSVSRGTAVLVKPDSSNAKLKVTFFWPFAGDYWILDLDPDYRWALVGTPDRRHLWILCRAPRLDRLILARLLAEAEAHGFARGKLIYTQP